MGPKWGPTPRRTNRRTSRKINFELRRGRIYYQNISDYRLLEDVSIDKWRQIENSSRGVVAIGAEFTVSQVLLQLWHGAVREPRKGSVCLWNPVPEDW
jgi:hypothetical protein